MKRKKIEQQKAMREDLIKQMKMKKEYMAYSKERENAQEIETCENAVLQFEKERKEMENIKKTNM